MTENEKVALTHVEAALDSLKLDKVSVHNGLLIGSLLTTKQFIEKGDTKAATLVEMISRKLPPFPEEVLEQKAATITGGWASEEHFF